MAMTSFRPRSGRYSDDSNDEDDSSSFGESSGWRVMAESTGGYYAPRLELTRPPASAEIVPGVRSASPVQITEQSRTASPAPMAKASRRSNEQSRTSTQSSSNSTSKRPAAPPMSSEASSTSKETATRGRSLQEARVVPKVKDPPERAFTAPECWDHQIEWAESKGLPQKPFEKPEAKTLAPMWPALLELRKGTDPAPYQNLLMIEKQYAKDSLDRDFIRHVVDSGEASQAELLRIAGIALASLEGLGVFLNPQLGLLSTLGSVTLDRCVTSKSSIVAKRVFEIPELCEMILSLCRPIDVMQFETAHLGCNFVKNNIKVDKWQEYMVLKPRIKPNGLPHVPIDEIFHNVGFNVRWTFSCGKFERVERKLKVDVDLTDQWMDFGKLSKTIWWKIQSMLIIQPPIEELFFRSECCVQYEGDTWRRVPIAILYSNTGITVGDVLRQLAEIQERHRRCPNGRVKDHDPHGDVYPEISANGWFYFKGKDKKLQKFIREQQHQSALRHKQRRRFHRYKRAKVFGKFSALMR